MVHFSCDDTSVMKERGYIGPLVTLLVLSTEEKGASGCRGIVTLRAGGGGSRAVEVLGVS